VTSDYLARLDALQQTWQEWARLGAGLTEDQWRRRTHCTGWDVAAVFAHHSLFPVALGAPPPPTGTGDPVTAVEILRRFNAPQGVAHTMAEAVAEAAVAEAARSARRELVERFAAAGPRALDKLRATPAGTAVAWPAAGADTTLVEALRIVLLEATVHLLDVQRALDRPPEVPTDALAETARLLAGLAPAVELIEAATGRSPHSPFPVLR
jgi:uncharacterized protein (TIGR03083 family)